MTAEQKALAGDPVTVTINVLGDNGMHVAGTGLTGARLMEGAQEAYPGQAPTVETISTGVYQLTWDELDPPTQRGQKLVALVPVTVDGQPWSSYGIPVFVDGFAVGAISFQPPDTETVDFGASKFTIRRGDDYEGARAVTINITSGADLTGLYLILAGKREPGVEFRYRMPILGSVGSHYANFDAGGDETCEWPDAIYEGLLRIEHEPGPPAKEQTIWEGKIHVVLFPTPAEG